MKYKQLGKSGIKVSEVCLGTMTFGRETDEKTSSEIVSRFLDIGGNFIDSADVYGNGIGVTEEVLGRILNDKRNQIILTTKLGFGISPNDEGLSRLHILNSVGNSLKRLQTDYIDILYLHIFDSITPFEETLSTLDILVKSGKVRYLGVSNFAAWQIMKFLGISDYNKWTKFIVYQPQYNLLEREIEKEFVPLCQGEGLGIVAWAPLAGGFLSGKYSSKGIKPDQGRLSELPDEETDSWQNRGTQRNLGILQAVETIAEKRNATCAQVALNWVKQQPAMTAPIIGVKTIEQYADNIQCIEWDLTADEICQLDKASRIDKPYPYDFVGRLYRR